MIAPTQDADPVARIQQLLLRCGLRRWRLRFLRDLGLFCAALALLALALLLLLAGGARAVLLRSLLSGLVALASVLFVVHVTLLRRRLSDRSDLARWLGARAPALRGDLLSTLELAEEARRGPPRFSLALHSALARQTWRQIARFSPERVVPTTALRPAAMLLALTALAWSTAATISPEPLARAARHLVSPPERATRATREPLVGDLRLSYHYPTYLRRRARTVESSTGQITGPVGTVLQIEASALGPYPALELVLRRRGQPARRIAMHARRERWQAKLRIDGEGHYRFAATLLSGQRLQDPVPRRIDVEVDAPPTVTLFGPADGIEVAAQQRIELGYVAHDDHGLTALRLGYSVAGGAPRTQRLWQHRVWQHRDIPPLRRTGKYEWDLAPLDLARGGRVAYWLEAVDDDDVSGPKVSRSQVLHLQVFSREERHDRTLAQQRQLLERALRLLAQRLVLFPADAAAVLGPKAPPPTPGKLRGAGLAQEAFADGVRILEARMRRDEEVSRTVLAALGRLQMRLQRLARSERRERARWRSLPRNAALPTALARPARSLNRRFVAELERDALLLANLLDEQKLAQIAEISRRLTTARKELGALLARYRKTKDPLLRQQIERQIRELQRQLAALLSKIAKLSSTLPDEYLNREAVERLGLADKAQNLAKLFAEGKLDQLQAALSALDEKLGAMRKLLDGNLQNFRDQRMSARERAYGKLMDRLHELESEQQAILRRTQAATQAYRKRAAGVLAGKLAPLLDAQLRRLEQLRKALGKVDRRRLASYQREQLERGERHEKWLREALTQRDLGQSLEMARRLNAALKLLHDDLRGDTIDRYLWRRPQAKAVKQVKAAQGVADGIQTDLESRLPKPRTLLPPSELAALRQLRLRQLALRKRLLDVQRELGGKLAPASPELPKGLQRAEQLMHEASQRLQQVRPQQAQSSQEGASGELKALRETLKRSRQPRSLGRERADRRRVQIPGAESFKPPREFRRDLLEAMKERPPAAYQERVRRYYRELVR